MIDWRTALSGLALGVVVARAGLGGPELVYRALNGQGIWLLLAGGGLLALHNLRSPKPVSLPRQLVGGVLLGVGIAVTGSLPLTLAVGIGEGRYLGLLLGLAALGGWKAMATLEARRQERASSKSSPSS